MSIRHLPRAVPLLALAVLTLPSETWAKDTWKKDLERALTERYPLSRQETKKILGMRIKAGNDIQGVGTVFAVSVDGIMAEPTNTGHSTYWVTEVENGAVRHSGGGILGALTGNTKRVARRALRLGEKITPVEWDVRNLEVQVHFVTVESETVMYEGTQFSDHLYGLVSFRFPKDFLPTATIDQVATAIEGAFALAPANGEPARISLGQTQEVVRRALGAPERVIDLGAKIIWAYKDLKVVFVDGKVSDVQ